MAKRIIAVKHANGRREYICPKCDTRMVLGASGGRRLVAGELIDTTDESLVCPNCGLDERDLPKMKVADFRQPHYQQGW